MIQHCFNARHFWMLTKTHVEELCFKTKNRPTPPKKKSYSFSEITFIQAKIISKRYPWVGEVAPQLIALATLPEDQSSDVGWGSLSPVTPAQGTQHTLLASTGSIHTCSHACMCTDRHTHTKRQTHTRRHRKKQKQTEKLYFQNINSQMSHEIFCIK